MKKNATTRRFDRALRGKWIVEAAPVFLWIASLEAQGIIISSRLAMPSLLDLSTCAYNIPARRVLCVRYLRAREAKIALWHGAQSNIRRRRLVHFACLRA